MSDATIPPEEVEHRPGWLTFLAAGIAVLHLYFNSFSPLSELWTSMLHFGLLGLLTALVIPARKAWTGKVARAFDIALGVIVFVACVYLIFGEDGFYARGQSFVLWDWVFVILAVGCALELTRRTTGLVIPILAILALTYTAWWGRFVYGVFHFPGLTWETVLYRATYGGDGMFGTIARISWTYVFMFILFGTVLLKGGASDVILALARAAAGRFIGGPGFVAVFGSGLMGSVSGSAIGNTVSTGVVTIPLMKQSGFPARTAAGIEAASSTGGQLMPPVMGAGAFLMATYTGESYLTIIGIATLPALLYFLSVAFQVRVAALKHGLQRDEKPSEPTGLAAGWPVLLPIVLLVTLLIAGFTPTWSAGAASLASLVCARFGPRPMGIKDVIDTLAQASLTAASIAVLLIAVGLVVMAVTTTGLGPTVSQMILTWSGGNLVLTLLFVALASLILGLGLPVTAAYVVLAPLAAPALADLMLDTKLIDVFVAGTVSDSGRTVLSVLVPDQAPALAGPMSREAAVAFLAAIPPALKSTVSEQVLTGGAITASLLTAHLIVFWLSQDSNVTPPVCLTAFAAAGLAGTKPIETGFTAWAFAKGLYIVPLVMAVSPLIGGTAWEIVQITVVTAVALYAFAGVLQGHMEGPLNPGGRLMAVALTGFLLWPFGSFSVKGLAIAAVFALIWYSKRPPLHE